MALYRTLSKLAFSTVILAWSFPYLYGRVSTLSLLLKNRPDRLQETNAFSSFAIEFTNRIRNCEDGMIVEEDAMAILSCDPGRDLWNTVMGTFYPNRALIPNGGLWIYRYDLPDDDSDSALLPVKLIDYPGTFSFHPLGVEYHRPTATLFVCNHHVEGSRVDVFSLDLSANEAVARHVRTIMSPLLKGPNSIAALNDHELYVSNDHYFLRKDYPRLSQVETYAGIAGGTVAYVNLAAEPIQVRTVERGPFPNGVAVLNDSTVAVAFTSSAEVRLYNIADDRSLERSGVVKVAFLPDNLSADKDGALLIAGHPHPQSLEKVVLDRRACIADDGVVPSDCWKANAPTWVSQWTSDKGVEDLYVSRQEYGSGSTAARDAARKVGIITGLYENGILVWRE